MFPSGAGGRKRPLPPETFGCPLYFDEEAVDCRLLLDEIGHGLPPGESAEVSIRFLWPDLARRHAAVGRKFRLWDGGFFAEGAVIAVIPP